MTDQKSRFGASGSSHPIDRAIDRAVRDMMWIDPPAGLRRRVLSRLDAPPPRRSLLPRFAYAACALAAGVIAAVVMPQFGGTIGTRQNVERAASDRPSAVAANTPLDPEPIAPAVRVPSAPPSSNQAAPRRARTRRDGLIRMPAIANVFGSPDGRVFGATVVEPPEADPAAAIGPPAASEATAIVPAHGPSLLQPRDLIVAPLEVKPIQIAPLPPPK